MVPRDQQVRKALRALLVLQAWRAPRGHKVIPAARLVPLVPLVLPALKARPGRRAIVAYKGKLVRPA